MFGCPKMGWNPIWGTAAMFDLFFSYGWKTKLMVPVKVLFKCIKRTELIVLLLHLIGWYHMSSLHLPSLHPPPLSVSLSPLVCSSSCRSAGTQTGEEIPIVSRSNIKEFKDSFSNENFDFRNSPNITFFVYVSNFTWPIKIQVSFSSSQHKYDRVRCSLWRGAVWHLVKPHSMWVAHISAV